MVLWQSGGFPTDRLTVGSGKRRDVSSKGIKIRGGKIGGLGKKRPCWRRESGG